MDSQKARNHAGFSSLSTKACPPHFWPSGQTWRTKWIAKKQGTMRISEAQPDFRASAPAVRQVCQFFRGLGEPQRTVWTVQKNLPPSGRNFRVWGHFGGASQTEFFPQKFPKNPLFSLWFFLPELSSSVCLFRV